MNEGTIRTVLLTVVGTLVMIISGWAGQQIHAHESRLDMLEREYGTIKTMLNGMYSNLSKENGAIMNRLERIEDRLNEVRQ